MIKIVLLLVFFGVVVLGLFNLNISSIPEILKYNAISSNVKKEKIKKVDFPKLTLEKIFLDNAQNSNLNKERLITLIVTGDVIPARSVNFQATQRKNFLWPFEKTAYVLKSTDMTFINLETPLIKNCRLTQEGMRFCGSDKHIEGLKFAGVDIASLANNHSANYGKEGIDETKKLLEENGISVTGLNGTAYKEIEGVKFAFLGFNDIEKTPPVSSAEEEKIKNEINEARGNADVVIVQFHWGTEYVTAPEQRQRYLGKLAIDSGADLVIGNHPHWIKPVEFYRNKLITYAHGNFVFDQEWSQKTKEGVVGKYTFYGKDLIDAEFLPVEIKDYGQPYFLEGEKKQKILNEMYQESKKLIM